MAATQELMASSTSLKIAKKELRSLMKKKLSQISEESISSQSISSSFSHLAMLIITGRAVFQAITQFRSYQQSKRIGIYLSMPSSEIQTNEIVRDSLKSGKQVFVPYLHKSQDPSPGTPKSVMDMVDLRSLSDYDSLKRDSWGIPTIDADTVAERERILVKGVAGLDMVLMPGVAFGVDPESGYLKRLGHGKGFYDYFLHRYRETQGSPLSEPSRSPGNNLLLYGLALEEQVLSPETVPVGQHDSLLHGLLVGNGKILEGSLSNQ
jgi:5-formyltetrahydrofolate cyclo-ligase